MDCLPAQVSLTNVTSTMTTVVMPEPVGTTYPQDGVIRNANYIDLWEFEKRLDVTSWAKWHDHNGTNWAVIASAVYLAVSFGIKRCMKERTAFGLRRELFLWNAALAIFSVLGFARCLPGFMVDLAQPHGLYTSICRRDTWNAATTFWGIIFGLSKIVELGDTLFIVLRKQPLIFLHYYHHVTVLCFVWMTQGSLNSVTVWCGIMNYGVHSLMYSYYALKALQIKVPKTLAMVITTLQLLQMVGGVTLNLYVLLAKHYGGHACATQSHHCYYALGMYASYFSLFAKFFFEAYLKNRKKIKLQ